MKKLFYTAAALLCAILLAQGATRSKKADIAASLDIFNAVVKEIQSNYVDSIDAQKSVRTAIDAMLGSLDPYTEYIPQDEKADFRTISSGQYGGIGSYIMQRNGNVYISGPYLGSPAARAGLRPGDLIMVINGDTVLGKTTPEVSNLLKGPADTPLSVTVKRPYVTDSIITVQITREKIQNPSVPYYGVVGNDLGYILLSSYTETTPEEVRLAIDSLKNRHKVKGLILDLRDNGGGLLESAVKILGYFLPKGTEVLRTRGKGVLDEKVYKTSSSPLVPDMPLVVLTDAGTASASEITAGALQDLDRAVIVGNRSFGKGLVQTTRELPYDGLLKVTMAKYYIPSGRLIQAIDYSQRNEDGSIQRIPDSLTHEFTTRNGRIVRDGGGITPDITVKYPDVSRITFNVVRDNWAFDFANRYRAEHPSIPPIDEFEIDDSIYARFKSSIDPAKFNYDKVCETILDRLREAARIEGYASDSLNAQFDTLAAMLKHPLDKDLDTHRGAIAPFLLREIAERYYYQPGAVRAALRSDIGADSAINILHNPAEYKRLLSAPAKK